MMLLMLTQVLAKDSTGKIRIVFGAFIASLLVPISLYFPGSWITSLYGKLFYSVIIILSSFRFVTVYQTAKLLLMFYFTTFSIGGGLVAVHFLLQNPISISDNNLLTFTSGYGDPISWIFILIGFPLVWLFTKRRMDKHAIEKIRYDQLYPVTLQLKNKSYSTTGYIDSGNQLVDPITNKPVLICDEPFLKKWFSEKDWKLLKLAQETLDFDKLPPEWEEKIQIVPFHGVEGKNSFLIAIRPDRLIILYGNQKIVTRNVLIGIQFAQLTRDQYYHCLIQPQIIKLAAVDSA